MVGPLDHQIACVKSSLESFMEAASAGAVVGEDTEPHAREPQMPAASTLPTPSAPSPAAPRLPRRTETAARQVFAYIRAHPGTSSIAVIESLAPSVQGRGTKSPRKVVSSAVYDLKKRGRVREDRDGRLFLADSL